MSSLPEGLTAERFDDRTDHPQRSRSTSSAFMDKAAGDPAVALDEHYKQAYDLMNSKEAQAAFDIGREPMKVREHYGRNGVRPAAAPRPPAGRGRRAVRHRLRRRLGPPLRHLPRAPQAPADVGPVGRGAHQRPRRARHAGRDDGDRAGRVRADAEDFDALGPNEAGPRPLGQRDERAVRRRRHAGRHGRRRDRPKGFAAVERVLAPENFVSTVYTKLGIDPAKILYNAQGRPTHLVSDPTPIKELMG